MKTFGLNEAALFLRCHPEELRRRARAGVIPGAKVGRAWVFLEDDLVAYLRSRYPQLPASVASDSEKGDLNVTSQTRRDLVDRRRAPNGERIRRTAGTANKALAQEYHDRVKSELWRISKLSEKPRRTWNEAAVRWLEGTVAQGHRRARMSPSLRWLDQFLAASTLATINRALIDRITDAKLAQGVSNATVNRTLEVGARDSAQVRQRLGMAGSRADRFGC